MEEEEEEVFHMLISFQWVKPWRMEPGGSRSFLWGSRGGALMKYSNYI